jgi:phosphodiesterase/alkaline phosphatase D-like protein
MTFFTAAPAAPTAATNAATLISSSGATLNGTVNANNADTTVTFEYGTTSSYGGAVTADQSPVTGAVATSVSKAITGLSNNTTYHYRVVAVNAQGTTYGSDMTFSTGNAPSATTNAASGIGASFATLNGTVNANNFVTTVTFEYGTSSSYGTTATADQSPVIGTDNTPVSKTITGLLPNTTYHYRVKAQGFGTTFGSDMTFTTGSGPSATTNAASPVGSTTATLNGTVNANNVSTTVTFEYGLNTSYGKVVTANQSPVTGGTNTAVSYGLTSLVPNTTYHYRVVASNANDTVYGAAMTFTTTGSAPTATTNAATAVSTSGATLNGTVNAKGDSTTVTFEYGLNTGYGSTVTAAQSPVTGSSNTAVSAVLTGLTSNTTYHFRVVAQNSSGTTYGADKTFFTDPSGPTATTQAASNIGNTSATLNGTVNANNNQTTVTFEFGPNTGYGRTFTADQSPVTGSSDTAVSFNVTGLVPNTTYHFRVVAQNSSGTTYGESNLSHGKIRW